MWSLARIPVRSAAALVFLAAGLGDAPGLAQPGPASGLPACLSGARWSATPISRDALTSAQVAIRTNAGNLALLRVRAGDTLLVDVLEVYRPSGERVLAKSNLAIHGSFAFDADAGVEGAGAPADAWWHSIAAGVSALEPQNGALLFVCPPEAADGAAAGVGQKPQPSQPPARTPPPPASGLKANGFNCSQHDECNSGYCADGRRCAPKDGTGNQGDTCHHDNHCQQGLICRCGSKEDPSAGTHGLAGSGFCFQWEDWPEGTGGWCGPPTDDGTRCSRGQDCASGTCDLHFYFLWGTCAPRNSVGETGAFCYHDNHCALGDCTCPGAKPLGGCANWDRYSYAEFRAEMTRGYFQCAGRRGLGGACTKDVQCDSGYCADGKRCAPRNGSGMRGEYCHHDNHCRSGLCDCPKGKSWGFCANYEQGDNNGTCR